MNEFFARFRGLPGARQVAAVGAVALIALGGATAAFAQSTPTAAAPNAQAQTTPAAKPVDRALERAFQAEKNVLARQESRLQKADAAIPKLEARIQGLKAQGRDTTKLEAGLNDFKQAVAAARADHAQAQSALATHAGFDANGKVVDRAQARQTVTQAGKAEREFHQAMRKGSHQLAIAIRQYRQANRAGIE
ncbi:MAG: hypothetical protein ACYC3S_01355 [Chloroflexota bacterium]